MGFLTVFRIHGVKIRLPGILVTFVIIAALSSPAGTLFAADSNPPGGSIDLSVSIHEIAKGMLDAIAGTAPITTLAISPSTPDGANGWNKSTTTIALTSSGSTVYYQWDSRSNHGWKVYTGPITAPQGRHMLNYYSTAGAENVEPPSLQEKAVPSGRTISEKIKSAEIKVDCQAPSSAISKPANGWHLKGRMYVISGSASDSTGGSGISKVEVSTDGGVTWSKASGTKTWSYAWTLPKDGAYTIKTRGFDNAGNVEELSEGVTIAVDNTAPAVLKTIPLDRATGETTGTAISATFSEPMDPTTINASTFRVAVRNGYNAHEINGIINYDSDSRTLTFKPSSGKLYPSTVYTLILSKNIKDLAGNTMASSYLWSFTTQSVIGP